MSEYSTSYDPDGRPTPPARQGLFYLTAATALLLALGCAVLGLLLISARNTAQRATADSERAQKEVDTDDQTIRKLLAEAGKLRQEAEDQARQAEANLQKAQDETAQARRKFEALQKQVAGEKPVLPANASEAEKLLEQARAQLTETERKLQQARQQADDTAKKLQEANRQVEAARKETIERRRDAMQQVVALHVARASQFQDEGDLPRALLWYAAALRVANKEGLPEQAHRSGIGLALGRYPKPIQTWFSEYPNSVARLSPDGRQTVTAAIDGIRFWDNSTGKQVGETLNPGAPVTQVEYSPDGKKLLAVARNGRVHLWDIATGKPAFAPLEHGAAVHVVLFSPDGKRLLTDAPDRNGQSTLRVWDAAKGEIIGKPLEQAGSLLAMAFSADGSEVLTGDTQKTVRHWNPTTGGNPAGVVLGHAGTVNLMDFSPDGQRIATVAADDSVRVWQVATGQPVTPMLTQAGSALPPVFSSDGRYLLTVGSDRTARLWNAATGETVAQLRHPDRVSLASFSPDNRFVLTACADGTLRVSDLTGHENQRIWQNAPAQYAALSPDGAALLTLEGKAVRIWDLTVAEPTAQTVAAESGPTRFSPDGKLMLRVKGTTAQLSTVEKDQPVGPPLKHKFPITNAMFSGDSKSVATLSSAPGGADTEIEIQVWDTATGKEIGPVQTYLHPVLLMAINRDGKTVLTVTVANSTEFRLAFHETATGKLMGKEILYAMPVNRALFTPDGKLAVAVMPGGLVKTWDPATSEQVGKSTTHGAPLTALVFSPDGKRMLTAARDGGVFIGEVGTGEEICKLPDQPGGVTFAAFSPDGKRVVTTCADRNLRVWDISKPPTAATYTLALTGDALAAFSPDGRWLATAAGNALRLWDAATGESAGPTLSHSSTTTAITYLAFTKDGKVVTGAGAADDPRVRQTWNLTPDSRPVGDIEQLVQLLTGHRLDGLTVAALTADDTKKAWDNLRPRFSDDFTPSPERSLAWARRSLDECEKAKNWAGVLTHLDRLIAADPSRVDLYLRRATVHKTLRQLDKAVADYSKAIEQAKDRADLWLARANLYIEQRQWDKAAADYSQVIERTPNDVETWTNRARAYAELGQWDKAAADFGKAITRGRDDVSGFRDQALAYLGASDAAGYKTVCTRMAKRFSKDREAAQTLGWTCALADGAGTDLKPLITQLEKTKGDKPTAARLITLAALQYRTGQYEPARQNLEKVQPLRGMNDPPTDWLLMAMTLAKLNRPGDAKTWLDKAAQAEQSSAAREGRSWQQRVEMTVLRKQAEAGLKGTKP